jgi:hypothetical protein
MLVFLVKEITLVLLTLGFIEVSYAPATYGKSVRLKETILRAENCYAIGKKKAIIKFNIIIIIIIIMKLDILCNLCFRKSENNLVIKIKNYCKINIIIILKMHIILIIYCIVPVTYESR